MTVDFEEIRRRLRREISEQVLVDDMERALSRPPRRESVLRTFPLQGGEYHLANTDPIFVEDGTARPPRPGETPTGFVFRMEPDGCNVTIMMPCLEGEELDE